MTLVIKKLPLRALQFLVAGSIGFIIDASILSLLVSAGSWHPLQARVVSFLSAVTATWLINRHYTFAATRPTQRPIAHEYSRYFLAQSVGAALNYAVFAAAVLWMPTFKAHPVWALALGSTAALCFNYVAMQRWVFAPR